MHTYFRHDLMRRYLLAFGSLFDDVTITRLDASGDEQQRQVVPLDYGPKERWLYRLTQDPELLRGVAQVVPRMSYEMTALTYDSTRKINTLDRLTFDSDAARSRSRLYVGVPYTMSIRLSVLTKLQQDGMQIVEQILPFFAPDYTIAVRPVTEFPTLVDTIPIVLQSVTHSDNYEEKFETRRVIIWDLDFVMKVYFYGPVRDQKRIEEVIVNLFASTSDDLQLPDANALPWVEITVVPSPADQTLDANTSIDDITTDTTINEHLVLNTSSMSPSASVSLSRSPSASLSPSASPSPS